jgi:exopolysaccharide biosynthesis predicted pyruvyltransferase EpsI
VPNRGNAGDALIAAATMQLLGRLEIPVHSDAEVVLVAGGGGIHPKYDCLAKRINSIPRDKRVIILPSTVSAHWTLLEQFRDLMLLCRDEMTMGLARMHGIRAGLCHDAAFSFDWSAWDDKGAGVLHAMRTDGESAGGVILEGNCDLSTMASGVWGLHDSLIVARRFVTRISLYRTVVTDRLHIAIAAAMLGKKVIFKGGNYFKNRAVFEMSLARFPNVTWCD